MIVFLSCYELGHAPHSIALALALFAQDKLPTAAQDLSVETLDTKLLSGASCVAVCVPMHTALRLGLEVLPQIKKAAPQAKIVFFGLYASLNEELLFSQGVHYVIGGEPEEALLALYHSLSNGETPAGVSDPKKHAEPIKKRLAFLTPARAKLPPIESYARLIANGERHLAGYTEASRGCLHLCTHCPIPAVYHGRFFVIPREVVLADIEAQVAQGAAHITFGDPDFLNGPRHALEIVREVHRRFPGVTFDFTTKVEHLLHHREMLPELVHCGAAFVVSAFESLSPNVLTHLQKGHTREDIERLFPLLDAVGLPVRPTFVPFTPWTTIEDLIELFDFVERYSLIENIDPIQYSIRLLIPPGSLLLQDKSVKLGPLDARSLVFPWQHEDARLDALAAAMQRRVEGANGESAEASFDALRMMVYQAANQQLREAPRKKKAPPPRLSEEWFC